MLTVDIFRVLVNVSGFADNERKIGQLGAPWILVGNVKVIGKQITQSFIKARRRRNV